MKKHLLIITSIAMLLAESCKKSEQPHPIEGKWFLSEVYLEPTLPDGSPHPTDPVQYENYDDPNFEGVFDREDYFMEFGPDGQFRLGPIQAGTFVLDGQTVTIRLGDVTMELEYQVSGENLVLEGTQIHDWNYTANVKYHLRKRL